MQPTPVPIGQFLSRHGIRLNTDLGQHFLSDERTLQAIVEAGNIHTDDHIVEIGPGLGVLTAQLLQKAGRVTAVELDDRMIPLLHSYLAASHVSAEHLTVIQGNALDVPLPHERYKMIANIPYHITSPLLRHVFTEGFAIPESLTLLIQREVAERICDTKDQSLLSILVGLFGSPKIVRHVPPGCFLPPPKVDSSVLHIACFHEPKAEPAAIAQIFRLTKIAFAGKRKMLRNTIGALPEGAELLKNANIEETARPQHLSIDQWIALGRSAAA